MPQRGFAPIIVILLVVLIAGLSIVIEKHLPLNKIVTTNNASSSAQVKASPSASPKASSYNNSSTNSHSSSASPSSGSSPSPSSQSSSNQSSSSPSTSSLSSPSTSSSPLPSGNSVKVTYPNGGELFKVGDNITITWDSNLFGNCQIQTINSDQAGIVITDRFGVYAPNHSINWTVSKINNGLSQEQYKIHMLCQNFNGGATIAQSDNYFTISQ